MNYLSPLQRVLLLVGALLSFGAALGLLASAGLPQRADYTGSTVEDIGRVAPEIGSLAPPFQGQTLAGEPIRLLELRGESVVLNFWATWCVPCQTEMPELQDLHETGQATVIGANLGEARNLIRGWVQDYRLTFPILLDPQGNLARTYRIRAQPTTFVIAPDGIITHIVYGATTAPALQAALQSHTSNGQ